MDEEKKYYITEEQLEELEFFKTMFSTIGDELEQLCNKEQDDIVYGFQLGKLYTIASDKKVEMIDLIAQIQEQNKYNNEETET